VRVQELRSLRRNPASLRSTILIAVGMDRSMDPGMKFYNYLKKNKKSCNTFFFFFLVFIKKIYIYLYIIIYIMHY
jgi:hypothetical protein